MGLFTKRRSRNAATKPAERDGFASLSEIGLDPYVAALAAWLEQPTGTRHHGFAETHAAPAHDALAADHQRPAQLQPPQQRPPEHMLTLSL